MRKGLKIKTLTLIIAWSIIFLHGVIPHNHGNHQGACNQVFHISSDHNEHHCEHENDYEFFCSPSGDNVIKVCHFSTNLHIQDDLNLPFIIEQESNHTCFQIPTLAIRVCSVFNSDSPPEYSLMPLRAPPYSV